MVSKVRTESAKRTAERVAKLAQLGLDDDEIASAVGLSKSWTAELRRAAGIVRRPNKSLPLELIAEIHRRYEEDEWPPGEISATLGIDPSTVHRHLGTTRTGVEWNKVARWAAKNHQALWEELKP